MTKNRISEIFRIVFSRATEASSVAVFSIFVLFMVGVSSMVVPVVHATGEDIQIISDQIEVHFPDNVQFTLEAEAEAEIVGIALYFKTPISNIWTYGYPNFAPGRRVKATHRLRTSGSQYLASGIDLEYFYTIKDSQGLVSETQRRTFTYLDSRFDWNTTEIGPLTIMWHDLSESRVERISKEVSTSLNRINALLRSEPKEPIKGIIYNTISEAQVAFPNQSQTLTRERIFQGFAFSQWGVFLGVGLQTNLIVHESAHLLLSQVAGSPGISIPAWVDEGFASYVAADAHFPRGAGGLPIGVDRSSRPLRNMSTIPGKVRDIHTFYRKAESVVGFMIEELGEDKFRDFIGQIDRGNHADAALKAAYGFSVDELERRWADATRGGGGIPERSSFPYWSLNSILIGVVALLTSILLTARLVLKRLRGPQEYEDSEITDD